MARGLNLTNVSVHRQMLSQQQRLTMRQMRFMRLLEKPLQEVEKDVERELEDNPALFPLTSGEVAEDVGRSMEPAAYLNKGGTEEDETQMEDVDDIWNDAADREEMQRLLMDAFDSMGGDDEPEHSHRLRLEQTLSSEDTLYETLAEQIGLLDISTKERQLMEYLVGALDDDGLLRKNVDIMVEELSIYQGIEATAEELQQAMARLKTLDPAGIGAQSLQECLLIQVERRRKSTVTDMMKWILENWFDDFMHDRREFIYRKAKKKDRELTDVAIDEIRKLNPRPGARMNETVRGDVQIEPDFFVETDENGALTCRLNEGKIPQLALADDFEDLMKRYEGVDRERLRKQEYEAFLYARGKIMRARAYIVMLQLRYRTLSLVMNYILERQHAFFLSGNDADLRPMLMKDVAEALGYDVSTVSRSCNEKYVQTEWGTFPLKSFFQASYASGGDDEGLTRRGFLAAMRQIIDAENKSAPLSDAKLAQRLNEKGFKAARRTVAKYREQMGIKPARNRKQ